MGEQQHITTFQDLEIWEADSSHFFFGSLTYVGEVLVHRHGDFQDGHDFPVDVGEYIYIFIQIIEFGEVFRRFLTRKLLIRIRWDFLLCVSFRLVSTCYAFWVKYKTLHKNCSELRFFRAEFLFSGDGPTWFGLGFFVAMAGWRA